MSLANLLDTLIDYPNSKDYVFQMIDRLNETGVITGEMDQKYKRHVETLDKEDFA